MDIYIFRHGQSTYNVMGKTQGHTNDSELTDLGKEQAIEVGKKLKSKGVEIIFTSPLKRAIQTANLANQSLNVPIKEDKRFIEVDIGEAEGLHHTEVSSKFGDFYRKWREDENELDIAFPKGETKRQVRERIFNGLDEYIKRGDYKVFAVSGHGIILTQVLRGLGLKDFKIANGAVVHLVYDGNKIVFKEFL